MLTRLVIALTLATVAAGTATASAQAPPECVRVDADGVCTVKLQPPAAKPGAAPISAGGGGGGGEKPACADAGMPVPCSSTNGTYSNVLQCYLRPRVPPPPPDSPLWEGHYPQGAVYDCTRAIDIPGSTTGTVWLAGPPDGGLSPEAAAQSVVRQMNLRPVDIGIVPEDKPGSIGAVGAPVYMWTTPGPTTFGPQVLTASAGGVTITATARVDRVEWSMGDGATVTCRTPGTPYEDRFGFASSPDCGHRYTNTSARLPGKAYPVVATSYWLVDWTGPGSSSGQIPVTLESRTNIVVGELQALVTG